MHRPYHIVEQWTLSATPEEIKALLYDVPSWPQWCPEFCQEATSKDTGVYGGIGQVFHLVTHKQKSTCEIQEPPLANQVRFQFSGYLRGQVIWTLQARGMWTDVIADWHVYLGPTRLKYVGMLFKPFWHIPLKRQTQVWGKRLTQELIRNSHLHQGLLPPVPRQSKSWLGIVAGGSLLLLLLVGLGLWIYRRNADS